MTQTKQTKRLEKLGRMARELKIMAEKLKTEELTRPQQVGMTFAIAEVREALTDVQLWSQ